MFVGDRTFLAGMQRKQGQLTISGFGGRSLLNEHWRATAFRETVEEIFHITDVPSQLLKALESVMPQQILLQNTPVKYITLVYTYDQLRQFLHICKKYLRASPHFTRFPQSAEDLVHNRLCVEHKGAEVSNIVYWPRYFTGKKVGVSDDILCDIVKLNHNLDTALCSDYDAFIVGLTGASTSTGLGLGI